MSLDEKAVSRYGSATAIMPVRPLRRPRALRFGTKSSLATGLLDLLKVKACWTAPVTTLETVSVETPASAATSRIVARVLAAIPHPIPDEPATRLASTRPRGLQR